MRKSEKAYLLEGGKLARKSRRFWVMAYESGCKLYVDDNILITDSEFWVVSQNIGDAEKILDRWIRSRSGMKTPEQIFQKRLKELKEAK